MTGAEPSSHAGEPSGKQATKKRKLELEQSPALNGPTSMPLADSRLNHVVHLLLLTSARAHVGKKKKTKKTKPEPFSGAGKKLCHSGSIYQLADHHGL